MDGNGRMGRFLMNVMLAAGGYPWTVVPVERRDDYMTALEAASVDGDIKPFAACLGGIAKGNIQGKPGPRFLAHRTPPRTINDGRSPLTACRT